MCRSLTVMNSRLSGATLEHHVTLLETLDRLLNKGVVVAGDVTLSVADVDLIYVSLRLLITSVETWERGMGEERP